MFSNSHSCQMSRSNWLKVWSNLENWIDYKCPQLTSNNFRKLCIRWSSLAYKTWSTLKLYDLWKLRVNSAFKFQTNIWLAHIRVMKTTSSRLLKLKQTECKRNWQIVNQHKQVSGSPQSTFQFNQLNLLCKQTKCSTKPN